MAVARKSVRVPEEAGPVSRRGAVAPEEEEKGAEWKPSASARRRGAGGIESEQTYAVVSAGADDRATNFTPSPVTDENQYDAGRTNKKASAAVPRRSAAVPARALW
jgi:hypothetical protein